MARATLDLVPTEEPKDDSRLRESIRRIPNAAPKKTESATWDSFQQMMRDRPEKFSPEQVNYHDADGAERCGTCAHFFRQAGDRQRTVCEIMRDGDQDIEPLKVCMFQTVDGENYPLLKDSQNHESH